MTTTRPGYIWSGTEWVAIGQEAVVAPVKYQASAPTSPATGDIWIDSDDDVPGIDTSQFLRWRKTVSGGETSVSGTDDNGLTLAYTPNYEQVYLNGVLLVRGQDYTATNGTSITGLTALAASDVVEVFGVVARVVGDVYTQAQADGKYSPITTTGAVLINTSTFTTASTVSVTNCFSSAYNNYLIHIDTTNNSAGNTMYLRVGNSGTAVSTSTYYAGGYYARIVASSGAFGSSPAASGYVPGGANASTGSSTVVTVIAPYLAKRTTFHSTHVIADSSDGYAYTYAGIESGATSYTDFFIVPSAGTITGTIKVYGYK